MTDDIEHRVAATAEALREHELMSQRCAELDDRVRRLDARLGELRSAYADEQRDVDRLEGMSLTRVLAALRGSRDDRLARERAEADAARYRVAEAEARLSALRSEREAARARLEQLASAPDDHRAALDAKERALSGAGDERGRRLLELAGERGRLTGELTEIAEARRAGDRATAALDAVADKLGSASGWSTYDTFFGGGAISSAVKQSRLDEAARAAAAADQALARLRTELADVPNVGATAPQLGMSRTTRFLDVWFDNIFTDLQVDDQIRQARANVAECRRMVAHVQGRLDERDRRARHRLDAIDRQRRDLLGG